MCICFVRVQVGAGVFGWYVVLISSPNLLWMWTLGLRSFLRSLWVVATMTDLPVWRAIFWRLYAIIFAVSRSRHAQNPILRLDGPFISPKTISHPKNKGILPTPKNSILLGFSQSAVYFARGFKVFNLKKTQLKMKIFAALCYSRMQIGLAQFWMRHGGFIWEVAFYPSARNLCSFRFSESCFQQNAQILNIWRLIDARLRSLNCCQDKLKNFIPFICWLGLN